MAAIPSTPVPTTALAADTRSLDALRLKSTADPRSAAREAAKAFEALFTQELMKSMRASTMASGMLDNEGTRLGTELLDSQLATRMAGRPGGLSDIIARQLERQMGLNPGPIPVPQTARTAANPETAPLESASRPAAPVRIPQTAAAAFVQHHTEAARAVQEKTGIPAEFMISQAALETGWGRKEIRHADGSPSFNLFGIKAGAHWKGPVAEVWTTEYVNGRPQRVKAAFRAYASFEDSFADYARLMQDSPRYAGVMARRNDAVGFAQGLQKAGYATDPEYARKLTGVINTTLRLQRSMA
jgi:flagellar protein FlgJ